MQNMANTVCVFGVGGVGGFFGTKIAGYGHKNPLTVPQTFFIARGDHLTAIKKNGLILNTLEEGEIKCKPTLATDNIDDIPEPDIILLCVKSYDLETAVKSLRNKINENTFIIPLLNGVDIYEKIRNIIPDKGLVLPACVYVGTHIEKPGVVTQRGGNCTISFGPDPGRQQVIPSQLKDLFRNSNIKYQWLKDPYPAIWEKYFFIAPFALVTSAFNKNIGQVMESSKLSSLTIEMMREMEKIIRIKNIDLPDDIVNRSFEKGRQFPYETKTSLQRDVETKGIKNESDLFGDTLIRMGKTFSVNTPTVQYVNDILHQRLYS